MKLICPGCGSVASAESWLNDALCRETMAVAASLKPPLPQAALGYLSLFRPGSRALTWKKAKRLVTELAALTANGYVQVQGKVARPCPARIWAAAMEQMVEQRDRLRLPMPNHNYLRQVAWDLADREDAAGESSRRQQEANGHTVRPQHCKQAPQSPIDDYIQGRRDTKPTDKEMEDWKRSRMEE